MVYLWSLAMGLAVGVAYALSGVRSPAPPLIALLGLLGMVLGEQAGLRAIQQIRREPPSQQAPARAEAPAAADGRIE